MECVTIFSAKLQNLVRVEFGTENGYTFHPQKIPPYNSLGMCNPFYIGPILPSGILPYEIGWGVLGMGDMNSEKNIGEIRPYFDRMPHIFVNTKEISK